MKNITGISLTIIFILCAVLHAQESWKYAADFAILPFEPAEHVKLASVKFINPSKENIDRLNISVKDRKGENCMIKKIEKKEGREIEIIFVPSEELKYTAFIDDKGPATDQSDKNIREGRMLIEDFVPLKTTKAGHWNWATSPRMSGSFSLTGKEGISFNRIVFPSAHRIEKSDKLVIHMYYQAENQPVEIMAELNTARNKTYFFSWGEDVIDTDRTKKTPMGALAPGGMWIKIEIPFTGISEKSLNAIGLYHSGGRVWWDRISLNEVPLKAEITTMREKGKKNTAYFNYSISSPFRIGDNVFEILKVDASPSYNAEKYTLKASGKDYGDKNAELPLLQGDKRKISLSAQSGEEIAVMEYDIPLNRQKTEELAITVKVLPYQPFVKNGSPFTAVFSVTNLNNELIPVEIKSKNFEEKIFPRPGETKHVYVEFSEYKTGDIIETEFYICGFKLCSRNFSIVSTENLNMKIEGPFLKNEEGHFLAVNYPDRRAKTPSGAPGSLNILLAGSYPETTAVLLQKKLGESGIKASISETGSPPYGYNHKLFSEYVHASAGFNISPGGDVLIFFPYTESMKHKHAPHEWKKYAEAVIAAAENKFSKIIVASPFPSPPFPEIYAPYRKILEEIASSRGAYFLDVYDIYMSDMNWRKLFIHTEGIYRSLPDEKWTEMLVGNLANMLEQIYKPVYP